ncbi:MAG: hypothetical protein RDV48_28080 [Candidatus Eremiobacteraeota bacterium]|nr:hypothetical protein [Candidatus Eremiobacteraeota bacterium]
MKKYALILTIAAMICLMSGSAMAATQATHTVSFSIASFQEISSTGTATLAITTVTPGEDPDPVEDLTNVKYSFTTNLATRRITAQLSADMPAEVTLQIKSAIPSGTGGGTWAGSEYQTITGSTAVTIATGGKYRASDTQISYKLSCTQDADPVNASRTCTLTMLSQ